MGWDVMTLRIVRRQLHILPALLLAVGMLGCVTGKVLTLSDGLTRPASNNAMTKTKGSAPSVAVLDFAWEMNPSSEIGRDYDHVRSIAWEGNPGKGISAVRAAGESGMPPDVPSKVWGRVETFRVDVKRSRMVTVDIEAVSVVKIHGSGPGAPAGWNTSVSYTSGYTEPMFVTADDVLRAVNRAANTVAEEGVRRLMEAGVVPAPAAAETGKTDGK
ncbi:MAG: hypothetical protein HW377_2680 [Actinobacteria bacterium]|nr:hypothetical protein [Actinomycetota bacterium]